jgi:3-deoxy-D-manno-octulosonic acid kinase
MLSTLRSNNTTYWFFDELLTEDVDTAFNIEYWQHRNAILGSAQGRGTTWFLQGKVIDMALRHYHRGGLLGKLVSDHYFFTGWKRTRSYQELILLNTLIRNNVNVPKPIAAKVTRRGLVYQADILVEKIDGAQDLVALLKQQKLPAFLWKKIGQEIRKMHDGQVCHTDLNAHNILIDHNENVWIIDFDKCYQKRKNNWKDNNLERLKRSFCKEVTKANIYWDQTDWQYLLGGYSQ